MPRGSDNPKMQARFNQTVLPHIDAAYNLARWVMRNDQDAEDAVQDAYIRAFRHFEGYRGENARAWLLRIVRNTCYTALRQQRAYEADLSLDDMVALPGLASNPETIVLQRLDIARLKAALDELPMEFREVVVLCELEGMSYREIAEIVDIPLGTVMSRLARARRKLQERLTAMEELPVQSSPTTRKGKEQRHEL